MNDDIGIGQKYRLNSNGRKVMTIWWSDQPHPSGDTKVCAGCGVTIIRKRKHKPSFWNRMQGCSYGCMHRSRSVPLEQKLIESFAVDESTGCWNWTGSSTEDSPGVRRAIVWSNGKLSLASRKMWETHKGPIPDGLYACHRCDNPMCVNLDHIFLGTPKDNSEDMARKGRSPRQRGSKCGKAKLTEDQVLAIMAEAGDIREIAQKYGVAKQTIDGIRRGHRWGWLTRASTELGLLLADPEQRRYTDAA